MKVYQGTDIEFVLTKDDDQGVPIADLSGSNYVATVSDEYRHRIRAWSSTAGSITFQSTVVEGVTIGSASFFLSGNETAQMPEGLYTLEIKEYDASGKAIGREVEIIEIEYSDIKNGL